MKCKYCYKPTERNSKFCPHCGRKKRVLTLPIISGILLTIILFISLVYLFPTPNQLVSFKDKIRTNEANHELNDENEKVDMLDLVQKTVFTVYTNKNQGSAFLYDKNGSVVTNAHVVEGSLTAQIKRADGSEYKGIVIGYSNEIDVAVISVPELRNMKPFPLEKKLENKVGEEVMALGSPLGLANTATFGYLTGVDRTFNIPPHTFTNVYQISAPIEPGNSGGPLVSIDHEKIIGINSAKSIELDNIAYSIPLHQVVPLIDKWIASPLNESEISNLFYDDNGNYYYDYLWTLFDDYYFDDGDYLDDKDFHHYWLYDDKLDIWEQYFYDDSYFEPNGRGSKDDNGNIWDEYFYEIEPFDNYEEYEEWKWDDGYGSDDEAFDDDKFDLDYEMYDE